MEIANQIQVGVINFVLQTKSLLWTAFVLADRIIKRVPEACVLCSEHEYLSLVETNERVQVSNSSLSSLSLEATRT
jgi:hypothetical protein